MSQSRFYFYFYFYVVLSIVHKSGFVAEEYIVYMSNVGANQCSYIQSASKNWAPHYGLVAATTPLNTSYVGEDKVLAGRAFHHATVRGKKE